MSTLKELLNAVHEDESTSSDGDLAWATKLICRVQAMDSGERDTIRAAFRIGPLEDGDVPSKASRDALLAEGMITKVVVRGQDGFNACTYRGAAAYRLLEAGA
jgi:hypothetical protein